MQRKVELMVNAKAHLGEGPVWDPITEQLYWVDILAETVFLYNPKTKENREIKVNQMIGALALRESGGIILAMKNGFYSLNLETEKLEFISSPEPTKKSNRFNDGKCDGMGRFWAGTMELDGKEGEGSLYVLETDYSVKKKLGHLSISNGLAWSPDQNYFYFIDTPTKSVVRYDFDKLSGDIANGKKVIDFSTQTGFPDGMTIDSEGMLWIAHWGGSKVSRWNPSTGEQLEVVSIPEAWNITSCTFGGKDLNELYITTARKDMSEKQLEQYPLSGALFRMKTDVNGLKTSFYKG